MSKCDDYSNHYRRIWTKRIRLEATRWQSQRKSILNFQLQTLFRSPIESHKLYRLLKHEFIYL